MAEEPRRPSGRWRLLAPALVAWGCAALAVLLPGTGLVVIIGVAGAGLVVLLLAARRRTGPLRFLAVVIGVLLLLGCRINTEEAVRSDPFLVRTAEEKSRPELLITIESYPSRTMRGQGFGPADAGGGTQLTVRGRVLAASGAVPVVVWVSEPTAAERGRAREPPGAAATPTDWEAIGPGSLVRVKGALTRLEPGSTSAFGIRAKSVERVPPVADWSTWFSERLVEIRGTLLAEARTVEGAELVPGFAVGNTDLVSPEVHERLRATSLLHLLAVSGANCALVTGAVLWCASWLSVPRRARILVAGAALLGFLALVGPDQSVQRAAIMAAVMLSAQFGGRTAHALPALGAAMIALLLVDPWQALAPGFALSVAATAGILLLSPRIEQWLARLLPLPRLIRVPLAVAIAAELAVAPFVLTLDEGLPVVGILANLVAGLAAPLGTGLGLLAALVLPVNQMCGHALLELGALPARWVVVTADLASAVPFGRIPWPKGWEGALLLGAVVALAWAAIGIRRSARAGRTPWSRPTLMTAARLAAVSCLAAAALGGFAGPTLVGPFAASLAVPSDWRIVACDIGQGDAIAIRSGGPGGPVILVDTGEDEPKLRACLDRFGIDRISLLVLTHDDRDHVGALAAVADHCERAMIAVPSRDLAARRPLREQLERHGLSYSLGSAGRTGTLPAPNGGEGISWEVLAPPAEPMPAETNAASQILRVHVDGLTMLMLADSGKEQHRALRQLGDKLRADLVKVAHHGSSDQDPSILEMSHAEIGLISVGADNSFGHPTKGALDGLQRAGIRALRTDQYGSIAVWGAPGALETWVERPDGANGGKDEYLPHPKRGSRTSKRDPRFVVRRRRTISCSDAVESGTLSEKTRGQACCRRGICCLAPARGRCFVDGLSGPRRGYRGAGGEAPG